MTGMRMLDIPIRGFAVGPSGKNGLLKIDTVWVGANAEGLLIELGAKCGCRLSRVEWARCTSHLGADYMVIEQELRVRMPSE